MEIETAPAGTEQAPAPEVLESVIEAESSEEVAHDNLAGTEQAPEGGQEAPAWEASYTFKVRDEEHKMDEWTHGLIKDEDTQKKFQDLYTRGHGLEIAKTERDEYKEKLGLSEEKFNNLEESLKMVSQLVEKNDARGFIEALGLPKKMFIDYAINELKFAELPAEEQQKIQAQRQQESQLSQLQFQNEQIKGDYENMVREQRGYELDTALSTTYSQQAQAYDERTGVPGSFRKLAIERGIFHHHVSGIDISAEQAIQEAVQIAAVQAGTPNHSEPVATGTPTVQPQEEKKVLPNLKAQGTSPTKVAFKDLEQVKAYRKQKYGF